MTKWEKGVLVCLIILTIVYVGIWVTAICWQSQMDCPSCNITGECNEGA